MLLQCVVIEILVSVKLLAWKIKPLQNEKSTHEIEHLNGIRTTDPKEIN